MKVLQKSVLTDGTNIQIEDWSEDYSFYPYGHTLAAYPIAKESIREPFSPTRNETFRYELSFKNNGEALQAYEKLTNGIKTLKDFKDNLKPNQKEYANII